jgi:hypothetical protein
MWQSFIKGMASLDQGHQMYLMSGLLIIWMFAAIGLGIELQFRHALWKINKEYQASVKKDRERYAASQKVLQNQGKVAENEIHPRRPVAP